MSPEPLSEEQIAAILRQFRLPAALASQPSGQAAAAELQTALARFAELLPPAERPADPMELLELAAGTNAFEPLRQERGLPVTVLFYTAVHPSYYEGPERIGEPAWRLCFTDGGAVEASPIRERLLDEVIRLAEAMHDKNPFGEVPFDGGKTVFLQDPAEPATGGPPSPHLSVFPSLLPPVAPSPHLPVPCFQAVTALYGDMGMPRFILAKGGIRYYATGPVVPAEKREALRRWAASSVLAGVLAHKYIGGPDMRMGEEEMAWVDAAAVEIGTARRVRQLPAVTGLAAESGGFPHQAWELTGRTVAASLKEALRHPAMGRYGIETAAPIRVLIQGFGDVGGSVARLLTEESHDFTFRIAGVADELGALYRSEGLDTAELLQLRAERRPILQYSGEVDALWAASPSAADQARPGFRGTDSRELILQAAEVFIPAAIPNVIDSVIARRLQVRMVAEGANNAVAPHVELLLHELGILYLPGQAMNWGGVKGSTLEALFRELTKRSVPLAGIEERARAALAPFGDSVDVAWALELLRSGLAGPPLEQPAGADRTDQGRPLARAFAIALLEDLARSNTRWLMNELAASRFERTPLDLVRTLSRSVRSLKVQLLSLIEQALGDEFFASETSLRRRSKLLDDRLKELQSNPSHGALTTVQVVEQRQMLQQLQNDIPAGLAGVFASLLAALDLARQKVMDPDGYSQESLQRDLALLRRPDSPAAALEDSLYRLQRVHPGLDREEFVRALVQVIQDRSRAPALRRNAALALAKLGTAEASHRAILLEALGDPDLSVRAACRWALDQMAIPTAEAT